MHDDSDALYTCSLQLLSTRISNVGASLADARVARVVGASLADARRHPPVTTNTPRLIRTPRLYTTAYNKNDG